MRRPVAAAGMAAAVAASLAAPPAGASVDSLVAAGPNKTAQFAWIGDEAPGIVQTRRMTASGTLGIRQAMSPELPAAGGQSIGVDAGGNAVVAWRSGTGAEQRVRIRRRLATGALSSPQALSPAGVFVNSYAMDVEPDGDAVVVWNRQLNGKYVIQARRRSATGVLSPTYTLSYAGANAAHPDVEVTPDGVATVAWQLETSSPATTWVQTRTLQEDGDLDRIQTLSTHPTSAPVFPRVAVTDSNVATIAWVRSDTVEGEDPLVGTGYYRTRALDGTLGPRVTLATTIAFGAVVVAGNAAGRTAFAWLDYQGGVHDTKARIREPGGPLHPVFDIGTGPQSSPPAAALDPEGNVTFAWKEGAGDGEANVVRRRSVAGAWGARRVVSQSTSGVEAPHLAVDADGKATAVWAEPVAGTYWARTVKPEGTMSPTPVQINGD